MTRSDDLYSLPPELPVPIDDGACDHLNGAIIPSVPLLATNGIWIDLSASRGLTILYAYPRTGLPDKNPPAGWDEIPGMRGCTPQSCRFRDQYEVIRSFATDLFGISSQDSAYQSEAASRLHLPFPLLSDSALAMTTALNFPTIVVDGMTLLKRFTLVIENARVRKVFYPVFPPDRNADQVIEWLQAQH